MAEPLRAHPVDRLIRELLAARRAATDDEIVRIVERMATAPFDPRVVRVRLEHRGLRYQGRALGASAQSSFYHLFKGVVLEEQWRQGTSLRTYFADLRTAARHPAAELAVFSRRGGATATTLSATLSVVPREQLGIGRLPLLLVVYSADRGNVISGYQCSWLAAASIPEDALWLR